MDRAALIFDIETIGDVDATNRESITALVADSERTPEEYAALCPPLARIVCVAWYSVVGNQLGALYDSTLTSEPSAPDIEVSEATDGVNRLCRVEAAANEADLLTRFGTRLEAHVQRANPLLVTFNGRGFDIPVLLHRCVKHRTTAGLGLLNRAIAENRYAPALHFDLMDALTFNGATRRYPLAAYAVGYGFSSPKAEMSGADVGPAVAAGRLLDVVRYCAGDVLATTRVYRRWIGEG